MLQQQARDEKEDWFSAGSQVERVVIQHQHWPRISPGTDLVEKGYNWLAPSDCRAALLGL